MRNLLFALVCALYTCGCSQDVTIREVDETVVVIDSFTEPEKIKSLDVVSFIDTSCSMSGTKLDGVAASIGILRDDIEIITPDYQLIFATVDADQLGVEGPFDGTVTDFDLKMIVEFLHKSSNSEAGFKAAYEYFTNEDVLTRDDASLLVFMFSDEREQSPITPQEFKNWILQKFPSKVVDVVTVSTWKGDEMGNSACGDIDTKYSELARLFGHSNPSDMCDDGWEFTAAEDSFMIHRIESLILTSEPVEGSIVVKVNGAEFYDWFYDETSNTVFFTTVPDYGANVVVAYKTPIEE